jgi:hypothetical protein
MNLKLRIALYAGTGILMGGLLFGACGGGGGSNSGPAPAKSGDLIWSRANNPSGSFDEVSAMAKDANALYIVGYDQVPGYTRWRIEKRNLSDGTLVNSFGPGGVVAVDTGSDAGASAIAIDSTFMYVVGYDADPGYLEWRIEKRYLSDGTPDISFGTAGIKTSGTTTAVATAIAIDATYMYVAGFDTTPANKLEWRIEKRSLTTGATITAFGTNGIVTTHPSGSGDDIPYGIAVDANALYIVGSDEVASPGITTGWRIEKRDIVTGATITGFGTDGFISDPSAEFDEALDIAIDTNYMYVAGYDSKTTNFDDEWRIEKRNLSDGSLVTSFGSGGIIQENPSFANADSWDDAQTITIDANYMYVAGYDSNTSTGDEQWRIEKRNLSNGMFVTTFGNGGVINSNANTSTGLYIRFNEVFAIAVDDSYLYAAGLDSLSDTDAEWRIEKRLK